MTRDAAASPLPAALALGPVRLKARDATRLATFYRDVIGLAPLGESDGALRLGAGAAPLVELVDRPDAPPPPRGAPGLFHLALLLPDRAALAVVLRRLAEKGVRIGASDHIVSEALYLDDPEGNGIEIYRDRPRDAWNWQAGTVEMATAPLDLRALLADAPAGTGVDDPLPPATVMGHVHLRVGDLAAARRFYVEQLGFAVTTERYPGALFVSAGGYHHHIGLNVWESRGRPAPPAGSTGLESFTVVLPDASAVEAERARIEAAGVSSRPIEGGFAVSDPWGTTVRFVTG